MERNEAGRCQGRDCSFKQDVRVPEKASGLNNRDEGGGHMDIWDRSFPAEGIVSANGLGQMAQPG